MSGVKNAKDEDVNNFVKRIKKLTNIPICSGFGIKSPKDAKKIANSGCDGIVIGSAFVKYIQDNIDEKNLPQKLGKYVKSFVDILK